MLASDRYVVVSADSHAVTPKEVFRPYVDSRLLELFEEDLRHEAEERAAIKAWSRPFYVGDKRDEDEIEARYLTWNHASEQAEANRAWEPAQWLAMNEADGVAATVIYPGGTLSRPPFERFKRRAPHGLAGQHDHELARANVCIYNRWLADFCAEAPDRLAGVAQVPEIDDLDDLDDALTEIEWAADAGLRGGILLPGIADDRRGYHDPRFDRLWAMCQDLCMPVNFHAGAGAPPNETLYGHGVVADAIAFHDAKPSYRTLWFLVLGGVLERFPHLRVAFTEQLANWVPHELKRLEDAYHDRSFSANARLEAVRRTLSLTPLEYWRRNCMVGATFMSRPEAARRHAIGVDTIMWGSDFPHPEGTNPVTDECLRYSFADVPRNELSRILGANAARHYGFDFAALARVAARSGPLVDTIAVALDEPPAAYADKHAFRPN